MMHALRTPHAPSARGLDVVRHGLAAIRVRHVACALGLALAWGLANAFGWWLGEGTPDLARTIAHFVVNAAITMLLLVVAVAIAQAAARGDPAAVYPYAIAVVAAALGGETLFMMLAPYIGLAQCECSADRLLPAVRSANMIPDGLLICGFVTAGYRFQQRTSQRQARLRARELERAQITRRMVESRLQAMQACIEPQFLFDTLADVERLHRVEPRVALRLIDELIVYLRAALPHLRESTSTVAKEADLVHAWMNIRRLRTGGGPALVMDLRGDAGAARMPPMLLLPLVDHLLGEGPTSPHAGLGVGVHLETGHLHITLSLRDTVLGIAGDPATLAGVRERLALLYGDAARLVLATDAHANARVELTLPHEPTDRHPR